MTQHLEELTQSLRQRYNSITGNVVFPNRDPDYQALIRGVLEWEKTDIHCHISNSLSVEFIWELFQEKSPKLKQGIKEEASKKAEKSRIEAESKGEYERAQQMYVPDSAWSSQESLRPHVTSYSDLDRCGYKGGLRDLVIRSTDDFKRAIRHVAGQVFKDNVTYLQLRFNPYKNPDDIKDLKGLSSKEIIEKVISVANTGFSEAEKDACKKFSREFKAGMIFSFDTAKKENSPEMLKTVLTILDEVRYKHPELRERMVGIDLSGDDEGGFYKYREALRYAGKLGFLRTAHFDALRMDKRGDHDKVKEAMGYIDSIIEYLDRIGHGLPLGPLSDCVLGQDSKLQTTLEKLWKKIKDKNIVIECCPSTNLRSHKIKDYQNHPFHFWVENGFELGLGIDGLWFWPATLSEEIARLLISSPYNISVKKMQRIASNRTSKKS